MPQEMRVEAKRGAIELAIIRIRLALSYMVQQRAQCGFQDDDSTAALDIAWDTLYYCEKAGDVSLMARASFWLGVTTYYSDDIRTALSHFKDAKKDMPLQCDEAKFLDEWFNRCNRGGPEKDDEVYVQELAPAPAMRSKRRRERKTQKDEKNPDYGNPSDQDTGKYGLKGMATTRRDPELQPAPQTQTETQAGGKQAETQEVVEANGFRRFLRSWSPANLFHPP